MLLELNGHWYFPHNWVRLMAKTVEVRLFILIKMIYLMKTIELVSCYNMYNVKAGMLSQSELVLVLA